MPLAMRAGCGEDQGERTGEAGERVRHPEFGSQCLDGEDEEEHVHRVEHVAEEGGPEGDPFSLGEPVWHLHTIGPWRRVQPGTVKSWVL